MKRIPFYAVLVLFLATAVFTLTRCNDVVSTNNNLIFPDSLISFNNNVLPLLMVKCSYNGCHGDIQNGTFAMNSYSSLLYGGGDYLNLVIPGKPDNSLLVQVMEVTQPHLAFSFGPTYINKNQLAGIRKWILEGAKNN